MTRCTSFAEGLDETSGRASFQQYFRKLARLIEREGDRYRMLHHILNARADLREQDGGRYERVFAHYHDFIERAVESGELPTAIDRELFAEMMRDVWLGNLHQWVLRRSFKSLEQRFMQKLEILFSVSCS